MTKQRMKTDQLENLSAIRGIRRMHIESRTKPDFLG